MQASTPQVTMDQFCEECGAKLIPGMAFCDECGHPVPKANSCKKCGHVLNVQENSVQSVELRGRLILSKKRKVGIIIWLIAFALVG